MFVLKHYFLSEIERFRKEEFVLASLDGIKADDVYKLDDQELMEIYNDALRKQPAN